MINKKEIVFNFLTLKHWLGNVFWQLQKFIFGLFIIGSLGSFLINVFLKDNLVEDILFFLNILLFWSICFIIVTLLWVIGRLFLNFDLLIYYFIYIKLIVSFVKKNRVKYSKLFDIYDSIKYNKPNKLPTLIRREHLMRKRYWPNWVFSIIAIFDSNKIKQRIVFTNSKKEWILEVDLRNESYGIYSNVGKKFLSKRYLSASHSSQTLNQSERFLDFLNPSYSLESEFTWGEIGEDLPIRWASGGIFSFVKFRGKTWAQLFFREINPIGLNIANGASEEKNEYKNLHRLIAREFSEETILLTANPKTGSDINQKVFVAFSSDPNSDKDIAKFINNKFIEQHTNLRYYHDKINISTADNLTRNFNLIKTPFKVRVIFHKSDLRTTEEREIHNIIYSLNPAEFGIEVIRIAHFELNDGECLIDGEFHLSRKVLIRRPVVLIDMDYLKNVYSVNKSLGNLLETDEQFECKMLDPIPEESCSVFLPDIELRHHRLKAIKEQLNDHKLTKKVKENLEWEKNLIDNWLNKYEKAFLDISKNGIQNKFIRTLCPVTWKTLEIIFSHQIKYQD